MKSDESIILNAYRRISKAAKRGHGVRLSAEEVERIWAIDDAIRSAVQRADYEDKENPE